MVIFMPDTSTIIPTPEWCTTTGIPTKIVYYPDIVWKDNRWYYAR